MYLTNNVECKKQVTGKYMEYNFISVKFKYSRTGGRSQDGRIGTAPVYSSQRERRRRRVISAFPSECFRALCCKGPPPARPEYDLVCIGLTGSGKTSLLSKLCSESPDNVVSTTGADNIRKYWSRYYQGSQGVIFVLDSASSEDDLEAARNELHSALQHPQLCTLPFLILANHQDKPAARSVQEIKKYFELEPLARGKRWILQPCSLDDMDALKDSFSQLINLLEEKDHEAIRM
ncbi:ADP-ribosylation factor-like protein 15 isoform X3 [Pongo abelii]|uniref:ADP-ribosylation factor-like protein 15 isoform X3 n=1 Tax=Pongo abelii TaxID=9601 RepID=UPI0023E86278|nr:ADP-ribosylation factor-like protein 15 isoform X3 [Pongo abelii]